MSFKHFGKEHRKLFRGSKAVDRTCRNHGSFHFCRANRTFNDSKRRLAAVFISAVIVLTIIGVTDVLARGCDYFDCYLSGFINALLIFKALGIFFD